MCAPCFGDVGTRVERGHKRVGVHCNGDGWIVSAGGTSNNDQINELLLSTDVLRKTMGIS